MILPASTISFCFLYKHSPEAYYSEVFESLNVRSVYFYLSAEHNFHVHGAISLLY